MQNPQPISILKTNNQPKKTTKKVTFQLKKNHKKLKRKRRQRKHSKARTIKILTPNANGITGKIESLKSAIKEHESSIVLITETKLESETTPLIDGYQRTDNQDNLANNIKPINNPETEDMETQWAEIKTGKKLTYIGVYYGPQERTPKIRGSKRMR